MEQESQFREPTPRIIEIRQIFPLFTPNRQIDTSHPIDQSELNPDDPINILSIKEIVYLRIHTASPIPITIILSRSFVEDEKLFICPFKIPPHPQFPGMPIYGQLKVGTYPEQFAQLELAKVKGIPPEGTIRTPWELAPQLEYQILPDTLSFLRRLRFSIDLPEQSVTASPNLQMLSRGIFVFDKFLVIEQSTQREKGLILPFSPEFLDANPIKGKFELK